MRNSLKAAIIVRYGSQINSSKTEGIPEAKISKVVNGYLELPLEEQKAWAKLLGRQQKEIFQQKEGKRR